MGCIKDCNTKQLKLVELSNKRIALKRSPEGILNSLGTVFQQNSLITTTADLHFFTSVTSLANNAFLRCYSLRIIDLPNNIVSIGTYTFYTLLSFERIISLGGISTLPDQTFAGMQYSTSITIPEGITKINNYVFSQSGQSDAQNKLSFVDLPSTVTSIGNNTFLYRHIKTWIVRAVTPPTLGTQTFRYGSIGSIYVPDESVETYKAATNWSAWASKIHPLSEYVED